MFIKLSNIITFIESFSVAKFLTTVILFLTGKIAMKRKQMILQ